MPVRMGSVCEGRASGSGSFLACNCMPVYKSFSRAKYAKRFAGIEFRLRVRPAPANRAASLGKWLGRLCN